MEIDLELNHKRFHCYVVSGKASYTLFSGATARQLGRVSSSTKLLDHTQRRTAVGRLLWTSDQLVAETTYNSHNRQTSMPPVGIFFWDIYCTLKHILHRNFKGTVVKVLCYKSEGRWFDPSWCHWIFHWHKILTISLWPWGRLSLQQKWVPGIFPGGKGGRCVRLTTLPPSCAVVTKSGSLNFLEPSGPFQAFNGTDLSFT